MTFLFKEKNVKKYWLQLQNSTKKTLTLTCVYLVYVYFVYFV